MIWADWLVFGCAIYCLCDVFIGPKIGSSIASQDLERRMKALGFKWSKDYGVWAKHPHQHGAYPIKFLGEHASIVGGKQFIAFTEQFGDTDWFTPYFDTPEAAFSYAELANWGRD